MKRARKASNIRGSFQVYFKQKKTNHGLYRNHKKQSRKGAEYFIIDKIVCYQHATLPKLNSPTVKFISSKYTSPQKTVT